jgi:hypothetical protein
MDISIVIPVYNEISHCLPSALSGRSACWCHQITGCEAEKDGERRPLDV